MNLKLLTLLLCTSIVFSQISAEDAALIAADQAFAAKIAICANNDNNWAATHAKADSDKLIATNTANQIMNAAFAQAQLDWSAAHAAADKLAAIAAAAVATTCGYTGTWVVLDWTNAGAYADSDKTAALALATADCTAALSLIAAVWTAVYADADAQWTAACAVDVSTVGNPLPRVPATVKAYNDCLGVNLSDTTAAVNAWAAVHAQADAVKHNTIVSVRTAWNLAHHAADDAMVAARSVCYTGIWQMSDWLKANTDADQAFTDGNASMAGVWTKSYSNSDAALTLALTTYSSNVPKVGLDLAAILAVKVAADQAVANAKVIADQIAANLAAAKIRTAAAAQVASELVIADTVFAAKVAVCGNCDKNWNAAHTKANATLSNAKTIAKQIQDAAFIQADAILSAALAAADATRAVADAVCGRNITFVNSDYTNAVAYANADQVAAYALASADYKAVVALTTDIWTAVCADADAQKAAAHSLYVPTIAGNYSLAFATYKAYHDCLGDISSATATSDAAWAVAYSQANAIEHNSIVQVRTDLNSAHHAADVSNVAARVPCYQGGWTFSDFFSAKSAADTAFESGNISLLAVLAESQSSANATLALAWATYSSNIVQAAIDGAAITAVKVAADQTAANAKLAIDQTASNVANLAAQAIVDQIALAAAALANASQIAAQQAADAAKVIADQLAAAQAAAAAQVAAQAAAAQAVIDAAQFAIDQPILAAAAAAQAATDLAASIAAAAAAAAKAATDLAASIAQAAIDLAASIAAAAAA